MASVNKVIIVGNLGADPEIRRFDNGGMIATVSVATSERWTDKQTGELKEHTEWHRIVFNNRLAEIVERYLKKGASVYVEGGLRTRKWTDQTGQDRYSTEIRADVMQMLGGAPNRAEEGAQRAGSYAKQRSADRQSVQDYEEYGQSNNMFGVPKVQAKRRDGYEEESAPALRPATDVNDDDMPF